jgi:hypothetical protein
MFIHTHPRKRSLRSLALKVGALILALASLAGCAQFPRGPLAAPSQPMYLADPEPRALGPLQPVSQSDVQIVSKDVPAGTIAVQKISLDMDTTVRVGNEDRGIEMRVTQHQGSVHRVQRLGVTAQGLHRFRLDYLRDKTITLAGEDRSSKTSPALGKSYVVEVGRQTARVFTANGYIPPPKEVEVVLKDGRHLLYLVAEAGPSNPQLTAELIALSVRKQLDRAGMEVEDVKASWKGVREIAGTPCAVFDISMVAAMRKIEPDESLVIEMRLSGEYALRVADGREAELFLTGSTLATGSISKNGVEIPVRTAGLARLHLAITYQEPVLPSPGGVASR